MSRIIKQPLFEDGVGVRVGTDDILYPSFLIDDYAKIYNVSKNLLIGPQQNFSKSFLRRYPNLTSPFGDTIIATEMVSKGDSYRVNFRVEVLNRFRSIDFKLGSKNPRLLGIENKYPPIEILAFPKM